MERKRHTSAAARVTQAPTNVCVRNKRVPTLTVWAFVCLNLRKCVGISIVICCDERLIISLKWTYFCLKVVYCYSYISDIYLFQLRLLQRSMMHDPWFIVAVHYCSKSSKLCARNEPRNLEIKRCWRLRVYHRALQAMKHGSREQPLLK